MPVVRNYHYENLIIIFEKSRALILNWFYQVSIFHQKEKKDPRQSENFQGWKPEKTHCCSILGQIQDDDNPSACQLQCICKLTALA